MNSEDGTTADKSGSRPPSVIRMLGFTAVMGPDCRGELSWPWRYERHKCPGCGYLRFTEERVWSEGRMVHFEANPEGWHDAVFGQRRIGRDFAWSQRVVDAVVQAGLTGVRFHPIAVVSRTTDENLGSQFPYWAVEITGRVLVDRQLFDGGDGILCPLCGVWKPRLGGTVKWDSNITAVVDTGEELPDFALASNIDGLDPFISIRAARFLGEHGFTGFHYRSLGGNIRVGNPGAPGWWENFYWEVYRKYPGYCVL